MFVYHLLVAGRERFLGLVFGHDTDVVLNPPYAAETADSTMDSAAEIQRAITALKAEAYDPESGRIDYSQMHTSEAYQRYRARCTPQLRGFDLARLVTRQQRLAFWINLYNALVIDGIIAFGMWRRVTSHPWAMLSFLRRAAYVVGGHRFSCEDIEHGILRANRGNPFLPGPHFGTADPRRHFMLDSVDPRIHFALNCGRRSCPPIGVYDAQHIDSQLDLAARNFVGEEVVFLESSKTVRLSPIFRWYAADFGGLTGVPGFLAQYLDDEHQRSWLAGANGSLRIAYDAYDWTFNGA